MVSRKYTALYREAKKVRSYAYAPYSNYLVGAALLTKSRKIFTGCNVENASLGGTVCAERIALFKAVSENERDFETILIISKKSSKSPKAAPCGFCRQVFHEFAPSIEIVTSDLEGNFSMMKLTDILPFPFGPKNLPPEAPADYITQRK